MLSFLKSTCTRTCRVADLRRTWRVLRCAALCCGVLVGVGMGSSFLVSRVGGEAQDREKRGIEENSQA